MEPVIQPPATVADAAPLLGRCLLLVEPQDAPELPDVAVLMAVYDDDDPDKFDAALSSLLAQSYPAERQHIYLAVDGPVRVELQHVLDRYRSHCHRIVINGANIGLAASLNRLIGILGDEKYVFRMDADDLSHPHRFLRQVMHMEANPALDLCGTAIEEADTASGHRLARHYPPDHDEILNYIAKASPFAHGSICFRRTFFADYGTYPLHATCQDIALWFRAARMGARFGNVDEILVILTKDHTFYRRRSSRRAFLEFSIYWKGICALHGVTSRLLWPFARLAARLLPQALIRRLYRSKLRQALLNG